MDRAMRPRDGRLPDRVPVMCQLALGHYFLHAGRDAIDVWHDSVAFAEALVTLQRRYRFDGILVNLPGREPHWRDEIVSIEPRGADRVIRWRAGRFTIVPPDDNPRVCLEATGRPPAVRFDDVEADRLTYVEPHALRGLTYPDEDCFPPWHWDTLRRVRVLEPDVSLHGEVFSPFSQLLELVGCSEGLLAMMLQPAKFRDCLARLVEGTVTLARGHFTAGADAVLISSAYAGAAFLSRTHYEAFVLPYERAVIRGLKEQFPDRPVYTHTCGAIGDRLDLMEATGTNGIDTLDPPPLGTADLADAKRQIGSRLFIKGNVNPIETVLNGDVDRCDRDARARIAIAKQGGGYILSTACSVPPHAPPENVLALTRAAEEVGWYQ